MGVLNKYTREIHRELGYFAGWIPGTEIELGDVGYVKGKLFIRKSNLKQLGIDFEMRKDEDPVNLSHASKGEVEITLKGSGVSPITGSTLTTLEAGFCVKMEKENSILLQANNVFNHSIEDQLGLGQEIMRRYRSSNPSERWDKDLVVVTEIAQADTCTILISKSKNNTVDITAKGELSASELDIAKADLGLSIKNSKNLETQILGKEGIVPMFRLSKVKTKLFKKVFDNYKVKSATPFYKSQEQLNNDIESYTVFEEIYDED
ncbi:hypothetical protein V1T75_08285 [Tenacibaculum sp. FZY0031]|uniref:hypothetical protein n=1 Tax=unclassified Tenacibaculum TaxID=2635139 RepID=UPI002EA1F159|nr:hypothetical protein [Tenacibaculum sp. FZY0031]